MGQIGPENAPQNGQICGSIILASRHRPAALLRAIAALRQQTAPNIEVIVVADPDTCAQLAGQVDLKIIPFDTPNISAARNLGLGMASGEIALFMDDDAVAEPTWAARLIAAFDTPSVVAATGFVRGRNGISYQWRAGLVDKLGADHPLEVGPNPSLHHGTSQRAVKTQGTNCAFRITTLRAIGGFDPGFEFYLDEADVNLRAAPFGPTMIVPDAQVHHGYMASDRRRANRTPTSLFDIAASTAVFLRKHADGALDTGKTQLWLAQTARVHALRAEGKVSLAQMQALLVSLADGWQAGMNRSFGAGEIAPNCTPFLPLHGPGPRPHCVIAGRFWSQKALHRRAAAAVANGQIVTVFCLAPTLRRHKMQFLPQGYWWQSGGIWGRSLRNQPAVLWRGFWARVRAEAQRIAAYRPE